MPKKMSCRSRVSICVLEFWSRNFTAVQPDRFWGQLSRLCRQHGAGELYCCGTLFKGFVVLLLLTPSDKVCVRGSASASRQHSCGGIVSGSVSEVELCDSFSDSQCLELLLKI